MKNFIHEGKLTKGRLTDLEEDIDKITTSLTEAQEENREHFQQARQDRDEKHKEIKGLQISIRTQQETSSVKIDEIHKSVISQETSQAKEPIWFKVSEPVESFTGRTKELEDLYEFVKRSVDTKQITVISQITSISGLGGIGKSELSRKYAQQYKEDFPDNNVIWINAENLEISFRDLAQELKISAKDVDGQNKDIKSITREIYKVSSKRKSLFIFDNADKYKTTKEGQGIDEFLPQLPPDANKPYIIITSRNQQWGNSIKVLSLGLFSKEEAIEFIKKSLNINNDVQDIGIAKLVETLQYFPLALQQAVGYIRQADEELKNIEPEETYKINDYLKEYEKKTKELLDYEFPDDSYDLYSKTTFTTWKITFDKIKQTKHGEKALEILNIMAYLAPEDIPNKMFLELTDEVNLRAIIHLLKQYSMIGIKAGTSNIHRLVQQVIRLDLKEQGKEEEIFTKTFTILKEYFPYGSDTLEDCAKKRQLLLHLEKFLLHIDNQLKEQPTKQEIETDYLEYLLIWISDGYSTLGDPQKQKESLERALLIQEKHYGSDHFEVASTLTSLGNTYGILGNPQKQKELLERALMIQEKHYGFEHVNVTLLSAAEQGQLEVVKWLVEEKGVNINATDNNDKTSLDLATEKGHTKISAYIKSKELEGKGNIDESLVSMQDNITTITTPGISNVIESEIKLAGEGNLIAP
ncbi:tetratricopeptide repeat protein [Candidatus Tisiphia endosymbiont of Dascillus cervinus]|uniref:tetratricopeptide repeat protein n=1 Tax=Candidatus Tisiphia endosymbiont of Dascillus cervinus TaxID=3066253 RepID=UPI00312C6DBD